MLDSGALRKRQSDALIASIKAKSVACRRCHARKVRCPGGQPCQSCVQASCEAECIYPKRDRQIKINQSYVEGLLRENEKLRAQIQVPLENQADVGASADLQSALSGASPDEPAGNPMLEDNPWFMPIDSFNIPILIGEVADAAFTTRLRQVISNTALNHIPRTSYPGIEQITNFDASDCGRPGPVHARFLVRTALANISDSYHIVRKSTTWVMLEKYLGKPESTDIFSECKILALFALGELYSSRMANSSTNVPGLPYFSHANRVCGRFLERPSVESIEVALLLCLYSLCINRRHSAYFLASSATRHAVVMGLQYNLPPAQVGDSLVREHLCRIWWTSYILDLNCAAISSQTASMPADDEIAVDLPSEICVQGPENLDFGNTECLVAHVQLSRLARSSISSLYGRKRRKEPFLQRVQHSLRELKGWLDTLPTHLNFGSRTSAQSPEPAKALHLFFNQCMIITTRPILLHILRLSTNCAEHSATDSSSRVLNLQSLAEACIRSARSSYSIVTESWIDGSYKTFDYANTRYLFAAATVLGISGLLKGADSMQDMHEFEFAKGLMHKLKDSGSFSAMEFCLHLDAMKQDINKFQAPKAIQPVESAAVPNGGLDDVPQTEVISEQTRCVSSSMIFCDPTIGAFLEDDVDVGYMEMLPDDPELDALYWSGGGI